MGGSTKLKLSGQTYNRLKVIDYAGSGMWNCVCECGTRKEIRGLHLVSGNTKSCGCLKLDAVRALGRSKALPSEEIKKRRTEPRLCRKCHKRKMPHEFPNLMHSCRECTLVMHRVYESRHSEIRWNGHLKRTFAITLDEYQRIKEAQYNRCAICGAAPPKSPGRFKRLALDHCHATGKVRQLLCNRCNQMLAGARDNIKIMQSGIKYLRKHSGRALNGNQPFVLFSE